MPNNCSGIARFRPSVVGRHGSPFSPFADPLIGYAKALGPQFHYSQTHYFPMQRRRSAI